MIQICCSTPVHEWAEMGTGVSHLMVSFFSLAASMTRAYGSLTGCLLKLPRSSAPLPNRKALEDT